MSASRDNMHRCREILNIGGTKVQNIFVCLSMCVCVGRGGGQGRTKLFAFCKLIGAPAPNQCQFIAFLTLKTDDLTKFRIELKVYF